MEWGSTHIMSDTLWMWEFNVWMKYEVLSSDPQTFQQIMCHKFNVTEKSKTWNQALHILYRWHIFHREMNFKNRINLETVTLKTRTEKCPPLESVMIIQVFMITRFSPLNIISCHNNITYDDRAPNWFIKLTNTGVKTIQTGILRSPLEFVELRVYRNSANHPTDWLTDQPTNQWTHQLTDQPTKQTNN
jgi:hypothetical protein